MKTSKKIALIVAAGCILLGALLIVIGRPKGGFRQLEAPETKFEAKTHTIEVPFQRIDIHEIYADVRILPATDGQCKVICYDSAGLTHAVGVENDTLTIQSTDHRTWQGHIGIFWGNWEDITLTVYLPEQAYESLVLQTTSGNISVPDSFTFAEAELLTTSGDVAFSGTARETLLVKSTSGEIELKSAGGSAMNLTTTSGDIGLSNLTADELTIQSTSGEIELSAVQVSGEAALKTTSGDIELDNADAASLRIQTVSGEVEGTLLSGKNFITRTTSGDVRVPPSDSTAGACEVTTTSGDIRLRVLEG